MRLAAGIYHPDRNPQAAVPQRVGLARVKVLLQVRQLQIRYYILIMIRATMLLSVDEPSDALLSFLSRKAVVISRAMFEVQLSPSTPVDRTMCAQPCLFCIV